jgi:hypothetical protein
MGSEQVRSMLALVSLVTSVSRTTYLAPAPAFFAAPPMVIESVSLTLVILTAAPPLRASSPTLNPAAVSSAGEGDPPAGAVLWL